MSRLHFVAISKCLYILECQRIETKTCTISTSLYDRQNQMNKVENTFP